MAAPYNKFNLFPDDLVRGVMNFGSDVFKILLTNNLPVATWHTYGDVAGELATLNGYTNGGLTSAISLGNVNGLETVMAAAVTWTASGSMGPFRYAIMYDSTPTTTKTLVGWWDYGTAITLLVGQTFTVEPNSSATSGTLFTLQ